jgi:MFS family permease
VAYIADLRAVLGERDFRRLFATRLISQAGDGIFQAGLATYLLFSQNYPNAGKAAGALAVLLLPYSLIGPFAGVFIDRWSRRQILVWSAIVRAALVCACAALVASSGGGIAFYVSALAVISVNRFFLAALSAALPHVVAYDKLVMANAVAPTSGTMASFAGGILGAGLHLAIGGHHTGDAAVILVAGGCYVLAGLTGATMRRDLLGPDKDPAEQVTAPGILRELGDVARGLVSGARHVWSRRQAAYALGAISSLRFLYGVVTVMTLLLYRNYFYPASEANASLGPLTLVLAVAGAGYLTAAIITPAVTERLAKQTWITWLLALGAVVTGVLGATFTQPAFMAIAFMLGVIAQGVKICVDTIIQQNVDDAYRGRVFSVYDMLFNVTYVGAAAISALYMPTTGKSYALLFVTAVGYALTAVSYAVLSRRSAPPAREPAQPTAAHG